MYNDEHNLYHYTYRKDGSETDVHPAPQAAPEQDHNNGPQQPVQEMKPVKKNRIGMKLTAMALCCALLGGAVGGGIVWGVGNHSGETSVNVSGRTVSQVSLKTVDGQTEMSDAEIYAANVNSVVSINVTGTSGYNFFGQPVQSASSGSGFVLTSDGYIVTNEHVISGATSIKVVLQDDSEYNATLVGSDERTDLAVLKIDATGLTPAEFGNSDQMQIGEQVIAIGNPGGLELAGTVTVGYVSAVNRSITTTNGNTVNCVQTDAAINPGNSGGALVNTYGQVIGINSQKIAATDYEGIGFAISINEAQPIINDLIQYGYVRGRVVMGITMQMIDQTYAAIYGYQPGIGVVSVEAGSPAEEAGLVAGDIITAIDGQSITTQEELNTLLEQYSPGDTITLTVYRQSVRGDGQELSMELTFAEAGAPSDTTTQQSSQQSTQQSQSQNESSTSPWSWMFQ